MSGKAWLTMQVITADNLDQIIRPTAIALGNFDGVHLGHQQVIGSILGAKQCSTVVSFDPHPQEFFQGQIRPQLTPLPEKIQVLQTIGVQQLVLLSFNRELAQLTAPEFMEKILRHLLQAETIAVGFNFRFGHQRQGTVALLQNIWGDRVKIVAEQCLSDAVRISSSNIRYALGHGDLALAHRMLGRPYSLIGTVVAGQQLGRQLGFPTANLQLPEHKFIPKHGVYSVRVDSLYGQNMLGVMNIGVRPSVEKDTKLAVEVHLLDFEGDLYGKELRVKLQRFLRPEQKFNSLSELRQQIAQDCMEARQENYEFSLA
ncbi:MAG: bifunctional riboflavin kinase/FAD synthetase [Pseudanabaenaceae cyanobacterium]